MGWWVFARDYQDAVTLSMAIGHARKVENIRLVGDQTDFMLKGPAGASLQKMLDADSRGFGCVAIPAQQWLCTWPPDKEKPI